MQSERMPAAVKVCLLAVLVLGAITWSAPTPATGAGDNSITAPDAGGDVGWNTSLALDASGNPVVSYRDAANGDLKVMHCDDPNCAGGGDSITAPDTAGDVGYDTSLALDASGHPVVSYHDQTNRDLKVLHCNDPNCAGGDESITAPDTEGGVGYFTSLALDASGYPVVSYHDQTDRDLKVLHCNDPNCAGGDESITSPDTEDGVGYFTSLALDGSGYPVVSYSLYVGDPPSGYFEGPKVLHCNDPNCAGGDESITTPDTGRGSSSSLALDPSGYPVVSYRYDADPYRHLRVLHCNDPNCAGGDEGITAPDPEGYIGHHPSLALDASGYPVISYCRWDSDEHECEDLKVLHCNDPNCGGGDESIAWPDRGGAVGEYTSLALDASGNPVVSYYGQTSGDLKVLHCGNPSCASGKDADSDGCTDDQELGPNPSQGGDRDPNNLWDFFDVPTGAGLTRDGDVTGQDIFAVIARFNATDAGSGDFDRNSDPLSTPNQHVLGEHRANYHPAYDRGPLVGPDVWDLGPADGSITGQEIFAVIAQFGHSCS